MEQAFEFIKRFYDTMLYLVFSEYGRFSDVFPHIGPLLFFIVRVIPLLALLFVLGWYVKKHQAALNVFTGKLLNLLPNGRWLFVLIFLLAAGIRLLHAVSLPLIVAEGDAMSRLEEAKEWAISHSGIPGGLIWLPLHFFLLMIPALFGADVVKYSVYVTLFFGLATFPVLYVLVKKRFGETTALVSCLLLAVNPFHIKYSIISMTEVPFLFFALSALLFLYLFIERDKNYFLFLSSLFIGCCSLIRFEGWMLAVLLPFFMLYYHKGIKNFFLYGILNSPAILWYIITSLVETGHLIHGLTMSDVEVKYAYQSYGDPVAHILQGMLWDTVWPFWFLPLIIFSIWLAYRHKKETPWLYSACFLLGMITWKVIRLQTEPAWRYFSISLFLLLPFSAYAYMATTTGNKFVRWAVLCVVCVAFCGKVALQYYVLKYQPNVPKGLFEAAAWIKEHKKPGDRILYNSFKFDFAGFRLLTGARADELYFPHYAGLKKFAYYEDFTDTVFLRVVRTPGYRFMLYQNGSQVDSVFHLPKVQKDIAEHGPQLDSVYSNINYRIYTIKQQ